jgi:general secretion pathway protein F
MAVFSYKALKADGSEAKGELKAGDRSEAFMLLDRKGLQPISLAIKSEDEVAVAESNVPEKTVNGRNATAKVAKKAAEKVVVKKEEPLPKGPIKLKRAQIVIFTEELSDLLFAGLQLEPALKIMESREELSNIKVVTRMLRQDVRDGMNFSQALRRASPSFGDLYCNLAQAGEVSGALSVILKRQAEYLLTLQELQSKVLFALIYPGFLFTAGVGVAILFITFLIPKLTMLLDNTGGEMPPAAKIILGLSDFLKSYWWALILLVIMGFIAFKTYVKDDENRENWDRVKLGLPMFGDILQRRFFVQFLETLANLVGNGLTLLKGLELSRNATTNLHLRRLLKNVIGYVAEGAALSKSFKRAGFFPPLLIDMVAVGEQTGDISTSLERAARRYDKELEKSIQKMSALIQPVVVVLMAGMVGIMAYMMISVIFETISGMNKRG